MASLKNSERCDGIGTDLRSRTFWNFIVFGVEKNIAVIQTFELSWILQAQIQR